jgi:hypothetical protein
MDLGSEHDFALKLTNGQNKAVAFWTMDTEHKAILPVEAGKGTLISLYGDEKPVSWHDAGLEAIISQGPAYLILKGEM